MSTATHDHDTDPNRPKHLAMHFDSMQQQYDTGKLGMWLFLATEFLFFGGLFCAYSVYRGNHPEIFHYGQYFLDWRLGGLNTIVLITSSLTAAWSVRAAQMNDMKTLRLTIILTIICAVIFMVVKYFEYTHKIKHGIHWGGSNDFKPSTEEMEHVKHLSNGVINEAMMEGTYIREMLGTFFAVYFCMTGLHGIHVTVGIGLYIWLLMRTNRGDFGSQNFAAVDNVALYWHVVDIIWIFLFPLLYLIG